VTRRVLIGGAGLIALAALLGLAWLLAHALGPRAGAAQLVSPPDGISLAAQTGTRIAFFGDRVGASALAVVDTRKVDPRSLRTRADFAPFRVATTSTERRRSGPILTLRTTWRLTCLDTACLPGGTQHDFAWAPVELDYRLSGTSLPRALTAPFEPVRILSRVGAATAHPRFRVPAPVVEPARYRLAPGLLAPLLFGAGALLCLAALAGVAYAFFGLRRRRSAPPDALALVLAEVRAAARGNGDSGRRRRALERLAELVEPLDGDLGATTRTLAWAPDDPPPDAIDELARRANEAARG
jgi:hypothetical protein